MTTYTFVGSSSTTQDSWNDPTVWSGDAVPDSPSADVVVPAVFNNPKTLVTETGAVEVGQISLADFLVIKGDLSVGGEFDILNMAAVNLAADLTVGTLNVSQGGELELNNSNPSFVATSIENAGFIAAYQGSIVSGDIKNDSTGRIESAAGGQSVTLTASSFENAGELYALASPLTLNVTGGGFLSGGTLAGGVYAASAAMKLNAGGVITSDAATIYLFSGGDILSYNNALAAYQPIEATLQTIASSASLFLGASDTWLTPLTVDGALGTEGTLTTPGLTIDPDGSANLGVVNGPVTDNGTIVDGDFIGAVTGSGTVSGSDLTFRAAASVGVTVENNHRSTTSAFLHLGDPSAFTGSISFGGYSSPIINAEIFFSAPGSDVTGYTYAGSRSHGTLTIDLSGGAAPVSLNLIGDFDVGSFEIGPATDPGPTNIEITVEQTAKPRDDFLGASLSDMLLENAQGEVDLGEVQNNAVSLKPVYFALGSQWSIVGTGNFATGLTDQFLIENPQGAIGIVEETSKYGPGLETLTTLAASWKIVETGDLLGDGSAQLLIQNTSGALDLVQVKGVETPTVVADRSVTETQIDTLGSQWKFVGAGDYLGLGRDEVAIENTLGDVGVGVVTSTAVTFTTVGALSSAWKLVESGDFLGDGKSDFLIDNTTTGALDVGEVVNGDLTLTQIDTLGPQWRFVGAGDYLGDGHDQILIESTAGSLGIGEVSGASIHFTTIATGFGEWMFH